jgi:F-type H+-transporting ATPase subunit b
VEQAKADAVVEGKKIVEEARHQIEIEKEDALRDIRRQVALLSVEVSERVLRTTLTNDKEQMAMIDRMLDEVIDKK